MGAPAAINPRIGTSRVFCVSNSKSGKANSIDLTLPVLLLIRPFFSNVVRCSWTVAREETPIAPAICFRVGATEYCWMCCFINSRICFCLL